MIYIELFPNLITTGVIKDLISKFGRDDKQDSLLFFILTLFLTLTTALRLALCIKTRKLTKL